MRSLIFVVRILSAGTVLAGLVGFAGVVGCGGLEKSAARDPMKCERDPKCEHKADKAADCSTQCVDDPACMDRCQSVNGQR